MMRLNIPIHKETEEVDGVKKEVKIVTFNATLFALVRTSLEIDCKGNVHVHACKDTCACADTCVAVTDRKRTVSGLIYL